MIRNIFRKTARLLALLLVLTSCANLNNSKTLPDNHYLGDYDDFLVYQENDVEIFDADNDGTVYIIKRRETGEVDNMVYVYDLNGVLVKSFALFEEEVYTSMERFLTYPYPVKTLSVSEGTAYYVENAAGINILKSLDIETETASVVAELPQGFEAFDMALVKDMMFIIGTDDESSKKPAPSLDGLGEEGYLGELIYRVNVVTKDVTALDVEFPVVMSKAFDDKLMIYAMDNDGYYFTEFDPANGICGEKYYNDLKKLRTFSIINQNNDFVFSSPNVSVLKLSVGSLSPTEGIAEIMPNTFVWGKSDIKYAGGYTFYKNTLESSPNRGKIERIKNLTYIKDVKKINMASVGFFADNPFGCGYTINRESLTDNVFALKVLSRDVDYDVYLMSSAQTFALNIKNKGSFYPLNDVKGVPEYIDACFPYLKETAVDENGDIWMLPIGVDIPCVVYNQKNCLSNGIDITNLSPEAPNLKAAGGVLFANYRLSQYMSVYTRFDNEEFRKLAAVLKEISNSYSLDLYFDNRSSLYFPERLENITLAVLDDRQTQRDFTARTDINAAALPSKYTDKNIASCVFLCVNPSSKNLDAALDYISSLSRYLYGTPDSMMFEDFALYSDTDYAKDLYEIYKNGDILFRLPDDVFYDDYYFYINGGIDLDSLIAEVERKTAMFLNE